MKGIDYYISNEIYTAIRSGLLSKDIQIVKCSIQRLISEYEEGKYFNASCKKDMRVILYDLLQNSDRNVRKWVYHLVAYNYDTDLIKKCIENLEKGMEDDSENVTWIMALASTKIEPDKLVSIYRKYAEKYINKRQYDMCTSVFSSNNIELEKKQIVQIVGSDDFLAKMWLTKIYACIYNVEKRERYTACVNHNIMNELLHDPKLERYALWAFSTPKVVDIKKIKIKPYNADRLPLKSRAWYYNCLFKDNLYVMKNKDHILMLLSDFLKLDSVVQFGILRGLEKADYPLDYMGEKLVGIYTSLDEETFEDCMLLVQLTRILVKHVNEDRNIRRLMEDTRENTKNLEIAKSFLFFDNDTEEINMTRNYTFNAPVQYNEQSNIAIQNNRIDDERREETLKSIVELSEKLNSGEYEGKLNRDVELNNMILKIEFELNAIRNEHEILGMNQKNCEMSELEQLLDELKKAKENEKKAFFQVFLLSFHKYVQYWLPRLKLLIWLKILYFTLRPFWAYKLKFISFCYLSRCDIVNIP